MAKHPKADKLIAYIFRVFFVFLFAAFVIYTGLNDQTKAFIIALVMGAVMFYDRQVNDSEL